MTERDESRDVSVLWDWDTFDDGMSTESFPTEVECFANHELGPSASRYVPHAQYAELEARLANERAILGDVAEWAQAEIDGLREEIKSYRRSYDARSHDVFRYRKKLEDAQDENRRLSEELYELRKTNHA